MSREIKFRYRYTDGKSWIMQVFTLEEIINGDPFQAISDNPLLKNYRHDGQDQYTGLKDAKGIEIYEGDRLISSERKGSHTVFMDQGMWMARSKEYDFPLSLFLENAETFVDGNIYENPTR